MDKLREDIRAAVKAAARRRLTAEQIEAVLADYEEDAAELEFRRMKLEQELLLLRWFVLAALISAPLLLFTKVLIACLKIDVDLPESWIMFVWALSMASGINSGYKLVKLSEYMPSLRKPSVEAIFTPESEYLDDEEDDNQGGV